MKWKTLGFLGKIVKKSQLFPPEILLRKYLGFELAIFLDGQLIESKEDEVGQ